MLFSVWCYPIHIEQKLHIWKHIWLWGINFLTEDKKMCHNWNRISNLSSCQMNIVQNIWFPLCLYYSYNSDMSIALVSIKPVCLVCCAGVSITLEIWVLHKIQYSVFELYLEPIVLAPLFSRSFVSARQFFLSAWGLSGIRFLLANRTLLSTTSETYS